MSCIHYIAKKIIARGIKKENDISSNTEELLLEACDTLTIYVVSSQPSVFIDMNENALTDADVYTQDVDLGWKKFGAEYDSNWRKIHLREIKRQISPNFKTHVLGEDDLFTRYTCIEKTIAAVTHNTAIFPMKDTAVYTNSSEVLSAVKLGEGQSQPTSYNTDFDMQSDESFSRIFFYGMGATLLAAQDSSDSLRSDLGPFVVEIPLHELAVRAGFRKYGCRIHFSQDQKVTAVYDCANDKTIRPGEEGWDQAKWLAKVNTFFFVTAREHLVWTHLIVSNGVTRESIVHLQPNHPLRRLLTIFTYRSTEVNTSAFDNLVPEHSLLHRLVCCVIVVYCVIVLLCYCVIVYCVFCYIIKQQQSSVRENMEMMQLIFVQDKQSFVCLIHFIANSTIPYFLFPCPQYAYNAHLEVLPLPTLQ